MSCPKLLLNFFIMIENGILPQGKGMGIAGFVISLMVLFFFTYFFRIGKIFVGLGCGMGLEVSS